MAILARVSEADVWEALRQAIQPIVQRAFDEYTLHSTGILWPDESGRLSAPSPSATFLDTVPSSRPATPSRGDSDRITSGTQPPSVASTPPPGRPPGPSSPPGPVAPAPGPPRRSKVARVRSYAENWKAQSLALAEGSVALGSATYGDIMEAVQLRRAFAYSSMASADQLEKLAGLIPKEDGATVSDIPERFLATFMASNPELC